MIVRDRTPSFCLLVSLQVASSNENSAPACPQNVLNGALNERGNLQRLEVNSRQRYLEFSLLRYRGSVLPLLTGPNQSPE